jgi:hypothetical protein
MFKMYMLQTINNLEALQILTFYNSWKFVTVVNPLDENEVYVYIGHRSCQSAFTFQHISQQCICYLFILLMTTAGIKHGHS